MNDYNGSEPQEPIQALIWTPVGRDGPLIADALTHAGLQGRVLASLAEVCYSIEAALPAIIIVSEEALPPDNIRELKKYLDQQPRWSDMPLIVLTTCGSTTALSLRRFLEVEALGHITMLERPLRASTLIAAVRAGIRARLRQFQIRNYLAERRHAEEELSRQARALARSNADLQQFAYVTSHDLREPLRNINIYAQLLERRCTPMLDENGRNYVQVILDGAARMEMLMHDLLSYSRVVNSDGVSARPVSLDSVLSWAKANLERALAESATELVAEPLPTIPGDEVQMVQLFQNLLSNAIKYRRPGVANRVEITANQHDSRWVLTFKDNGQGFHADYKHSIFGLFKRLHGRDIPGTGIGLAICKNIVERHGGSISAEGFPGVGAVFRVALPAKQEHLDS